MLVNIVSIQQRRGLEAMQQVFGQGIEQCLWPVADGNTLQSWAVLITPGIEQATDSLVKGGELGVGEDIGLDLGLLHHELQVAGALRGEQGAAQVGHHLPILL
ncbi:hypothetical protein D3C76_922870 [compost metagenome]